MVPHPAGIIIAASVIVAAGIAAYENPQFREWFERSREKVALAFQSTLDDIRPPRSRRDDPSMKEDQDEKAEERRRQARQEILDRGKKLEELRQRKKMSGSDLSLNEKRSPGFDALVDEQGKLRSDALPEPTAKSSAVQAQDTTEQTVRPRRVEQQQEDRSQEQVPQPQAMHESIDAPMLLRQLPGPTVSAAEPWESRYEHEMRNTWNLPLPTNRTPLASTHPSESLVDLTPTTEDFPDPDYSVPSGSENGSRLIDRTEYFSIPPTSRTASRVATDRLSDSESYYYARPSSPMQPLQPRRLSNSQAQNLGRRPGSSSASVAGSSNHGLDRTHNIVAPLSDFESEDDFSEIADGIRTPASAWTDVGSTISQSDADEIR